MSCIVKICGITNVEDAQAAVKERADLLGFIFVAASPRSVSPENAKAIIGSLPQTVKTVGVFQNEELQKVKEIADQLNLDFVQLHGQESPEYCKEVGSRIIKVLELNGDEDSLAAFSSKCDLYKDIAEIILVDRPKSAVKSGHEWLTSTVDYLKTMDLKEMPIVMAGGLNSENVRLVIDALSPHGIDCASGVEVSPGVKDHKKLKQFMTAIKGELVS